MNNISSHSAINIVQVGHSKTWDGVGRDTCKVKGAFLPSYGLFMRMLDVTAKDYEMGYGKKPTKEQIQFLVVTGMAGRSVNIKGIKDAIKEYGRKNKREVERILVHTNFSSDKYISMLFVTYKGNAPRMKRTTLNKIGGNDMISYEAVLSDLEEPCSMVRGFNRDYTTYKGEDEQFQPIEDKFKNFKTDVLGVLGADVCNQIKANGVGYSFLALLALSDFKCSELPVTDTYYTSSRIWCIKPRIHTDYY